MRNTEVVVVRTGTANMASVLAGLRRAGAAPRLSEQAEDIAQASHVMVPGVGAFGATLAELRLSGLVEVLQERMARPDRATLGICMGMQLFCEASEESPGIEGLGVVPVHVRRFGPEVRIPQLGWNLARPQPGCKLLTEGFVYFANSYHLPFVPAGWQGATSEHGRTFVAALERQNQLLCQFHPELSGPWGIDLMARWISAGQTRSS